MALPYYSPASNIDLHKKAPTVSFTLPLTCQICLGKV